MSEIKPCPFCGSLAELDSEYDHHCLSGKCTGWARVNCTSCNAGGPVLHSGSGGKSVSPEIMKDEAVKLWNNQAALSSAEARCRELEDAEHEARIVLALNHGHKGIYRDDGEIQCGACNPAWNYKMLPLLTVVKTAMGVLAADLARLRAENEALRGIGTAKNVKEIVTRYLTANGFDGLYDDECGCFTGDLFPCESDPGKCKPGVKETCDDGYGNQTEIIVQAALGAKEG